MSWGSTRAAGSDQHREKHSGLSLSSHPMLSLGLIVLGDEPPLAFLRSPWLMFQPEPKPGHPFLEQPPVQWKDCGPMGSALCGEALW